LKRIVIKLLVSIGLMLFLVIPTFASTTTYKLDELGLEVSIPSTYDVITQDTSTSNPVFNRLGASGNEFIDYYKENGIYLNAIPKDNLNEEIVVTMTAGIWDNLSAFSDTTIKTLASALISGYEDYGIIVSDYDVYQHSQAKFIKIYFTDSTNSVYGLQFYTTYGAKAMNFTIRSYSGELSQKQEETITSIVDSIKYDTPPVSAATVPETDSFVYTDVDTNTKFTVPANWYEKELSKEREFIDVKFMSAQEEGMSIIYGSTDVWGMMTEEERDGAKRSDINNSSFTLEDMTEFFGVDKSEISRVRYNGVEYFQATVKDSTELYGFDFTAEMTHLVRYDNGWIYWFQFGGTTSNEYFSDFEQLLNSVQYPLTSTVPNSNSAGISNNTYSGSSPADDDFTTNLLKLLVVSFIGTVFVYMLCPFIIILTRKKFSKKVLRRIVIINGIAGFIVFTVFNFIVGEEQGAKLHVTMLWSSIAYAILLKTSLKPEPIQTPSDNVEIQFCRKCGNKLLEGARFCNKCGTEVINEEE